MGTKPLATERRCDGTLPRPGKWSVKFSWILLALVVMVVFLFSQRSMADPDIGWHMRNAEHLFQTGHFVRSDMFSFTTRNSAWIDHEWLAETPFYVAWKHFGEAGLYLVTLALLEAIFLGVYLLSYVQCRNLLSACVVTTAAIFLGTVSFGPRTLLCGWILLVLELLVLQRFYQGARSGDESNPSQHELIWLLPAIFLVWVNTHGSWFIGLVVLMVFVVSGLWTVDLGSIQGRGWTVPQRRTLIVVAVLCLSVLFVNPYGWHLVVYPLDLAFRQKLNIGNVQEWAALDPRGLRGRILLGGVALSFVSQLRLRRVWTPHEVALFFMGTYAAMCYNRFVFFAAILVLPLIASDLCRWIKNTARPERPVMNALCLLLLVLVGSYASLVRRREIMANAGSDYPLQAITYISTYLPAGRMFNEYAWGGCLEWRAPSLPVFVDSRADVFERAGVFSDYLRTVSLDDTLEILDKYKIRYVLFERNAPLIYLLRQSPAWKVSYEDNIAIVMERVPRL